MIEAPSAADQPAAPGSLSLAVRKASPAVVSINTSTAARPNPRGGDPWFRFFFGDQGNQPQAGLGSGVIVSPAGYILTNNHVVDGADEIEVGVGQTVTGGIHSALGRNQLGINTFENFIQTDAAINPGNSGGALIDVNGHLMGINTAIYSRSGGSMGIGFAIPVSTARMVMESIVRDGQVTRGWIGVEPNELTPELAETFGVKAQSGVIITGVLQNGAAAQAGVRPGDVITAIAGEPVRSVSELLTRVAALKPGVPAQFALLRQNDKLTLDLTPGVRPASRPAQR